MKKYKYSTFTIFVFLAFIISGCSQVKQEEATEEKQSNEMNHEGNSEGVEEEQNHEGMDHEEASMTMSEDGTITWRPEGDAPNLITKDFHFIIGGVENIESEVLQNAQGEDILRLTLNGTTNAFVFHQTYGNIGMATNIDTRDFDGTIKLIHHTIDSENYEFVSITGSNMKLGRIVEGVEDIFDEKSFTADGDRLNLRVSAAGTHFKGYIGSETITHGHGDKMKNGYVGIWLEGTGSIGIKSIELIELEDE